MGIKCYIVIHQAKYYTLKLKHHRTHAAVFFKYITFAIVGVAATRTLPGGWNATSAKPQNQRAWVAAAVPLFPLVVTGVGAAWECVVAEAWTVVGQLEAEAQGALVGPEDSVEVGAATEEDSEGVAGWTEEVSVVPAVEDRPWTEWVAEAEEEWARQAERWI